MSSLEGPLEHDAGAAYPAVTRHRLLGGAGGGAGGPWGAELLPSGTLDIESAEDFRRTFSRLLDGGATRFLVDLSGLEYLDSTGLGALMQLHRRVKGVGGATHLFDAPPPVGEVFGITHLDRVIRLHPSREDALEQARSL